MIIEYPGYSIYKGETSEESILADIEPVWNFVINILKFERQDLLIMGRSIGSGPATHFASSHQVGGLVLISGFTSLKCVVKHNFGSIGSSFIKQRFHNEEKIKKIKCPCLFIHGADDALIPPQHSKTLYSRLRLLRYLSAACRTSDILGHDTPLLRHRRLCGYADTAVSRESRADMDAADDCHQPASLLPARAASSVRLLVE